MTNAQPHRKPGIEAKAIGAETLLYNESGEEIHVLNTIAAFIWELCDGQHTPQDMERAIREQYSVVAEMNVIADIERTLQVFRTKNLLISPALGDASR
jgi:hypothetical protein